jgi:hypothetical protein
MARSGERSFARWVFACTFGEFLGFMAAGSLAYALFRAIPDPNTPGLAFVLIAGCVAVGIVEGCCLGTLQGAVLARWFPGLSSSAWVRASALAAAVGWLLGALPSTLISLFDSGVATGAPPEPSSSFIFVTITAAGLVLGALFGVIQYRALRRHATRSASWISANAVGWAAALPLSFVSAGSEIAAGSVVLAAVVAGATGLGMGALVALATWFAVRRMEATNPSAARE